MALSIVVSCPKVAVRTLGSTKTGHPVPVVCNWLRLTEIKIKILNGVKQGLTTEQIAGQPNLSYITVQTHRKNISRKLPLLTQKELYDFLDTLEE